MDNFELTFPIHYWHNIYRGINHATVGIIKEKSGFTSLKNKPSLQLFVHTFIVTSNLTNRRNSTKTNTEGSLHFPERKSTGALQACCFEVSGAAGAWRECEFKQPQETYPGGRIDPSPPSKLPDRLEQWCPTFSSAHNSLIRKICSRAAFEKYLSY